MNQAFLPVSSGYALKDYIGGGHSGRVLRAEAPGGIQVAAKIIQGANAQEIRGLELTKRLRHPFLLQTHAYWSLDDGALIIIMELADGSMSGRLKECREADLPGIPVGELLRYMREAAEALDYLHSQHLQHRDIKPDNILRLQGHAKVADFGLARLHEGIRLLQATVCGTPAYMAPEIWMGKISRNSDQYSLAMTYIELRLGRCPFQAADLMQMWQRHVEELPDIAGLGPAEQQVILKAVSKDADQRYGSCREFAEKLANAAEGTTIAF